MKMFSISTFAAATAFVVGAVMANPSQAIPFANGSSWNGGAFNGSGWNGSGWNGSGWNGGGWNGSGWNGSGWNGGGWNGGGWNGGGWNGGGWNGVGMANGSKLRGTDESRTAPEGRATSKFDLNAVTVREVILNFAPQRPEAK